MNLQQFLEEEIELFEKRYKNISTPIKSYGEYCDVRDFVRTSNTRLINKVLSEVQSEVEKKQEELCIKHENHAYGDCDFESIDISTIIESLKIK